MKRILKSKEELLNANFDKLSFEERQIKLELIKDPTLSINEAKRESERFFKGVDHDIDLLRNESKFKVIKGRIVKYISTFFFTLIFSIWAYLIISFISVIANPNETNYLMGVWLYFGTLICFILILMNIWNRNANLIRLGLHLIGFLFVFALFSWITGWNINLDIAKVVLLDDKEYVENDDYDGGPYSGPMGGYSTENKYFIGLDLLKEGTFSNDSVKIVKNGSEASLIYKSEDEIYLHVTYAIFWQYAIVKGYKPVGRHYESDGFLTASLNILPFYLLEIIIQSLIKGFIFSLIILLLVIFKDYDINSKEEF